MDDGVSDAENDLDWDPDDNDREAVVPEAVQLLLPSALTHAQQTRLGV